MFPLTLVVLFKMTSLRQQLDLKNDVGNFYICHELPSRMAYGNFENGELNKKLWFNHSYDVEAFLMQVNI